MRCLLAPSLPMLAAVFVLAGCAGADNQDLFQPRADEAAPRGSRTSTEPSAPASPPATATADETPSAGDTSGTEPASPEPPSGSPPEGSAPSNPAPPAEPAQPPAPPCVAELEPNSNALSATPFDTRFCGQIGSSSDVDWGTFVVPAGAKKFSYTTSAQGGAIKLGFSWNGIPIDVANVKPLAGTRYQVKISRGAGSASDRPTYELQLAYE